jgi:predicted acetyltransferase
MTFSAVLIGRQATHATHAFLGGGAGIESCLPKPEWYEEIMPELSRPSVAVHASFLAAIDEFVAEGRGPQDGTMIGHDIATYGPTWGTPDGFEAYVRHLNDQVHEEAPRPAHHVPSTTMWWVDGSEYLGRISVRHRLTPALLEIGGHIGYDVRASVRRRGYATEMLRLALPVAHDLGIDPALLTCDTANVASRRVIERNGGVFEDERYSKLRYWVPTCCAG